MHCLSFACRLNTYLPFNFVLFEFIEYLYNMANKRKHKTLTLKEKCEVLKKLENGASGKQLARDYNVGAATICDIKRNKENILNFVSKRREKALKIRTLKSAEYPEMEEKLHEWFLKQRDRNAPVSEDLLRMKSKTLFKKMYGPERAFSASRGWIAKFRKRYGIRNLKICGEKLSADPEAVAPFRDILSNKIKEAGLSLCQVYNADESGLYWKLLPDKTLVNSQEKTAPGRKTSKERVTFLACTNATGTHMLKLLVIGKSRKPRSFGSDWSNLPVQYDSTANAWMTAVVFKNWFFNSFVPQVRAFMRSNGLPEKALLILDNAPSHPPASELISEDGMITTIFLPPNCTSLIQPMDQNVIRLTKLNYKKNLLSHVTNLEGSEINTFLKNITLKDAVFFLAGAWAELNRETVQKCWKPLVSFPALEEWDPEDDIPLAKLIEQGNDIPNPEFENFRQTIRAISGIDLTVDEINAWLDDNNIEENITQIDSEEEEDINEDQQTKIKHMDAIKGLTISLEWAVQNDASTCDILALHRLKEKALTTFNAQKKKQTLITDFAINTL